VTGGVPQRWCQTSCLKVMKISEAGGMARTSLPCHRPSDCSSWNRTGALLAIAFLSAQGTEYVLQGGVLALIVIFRAEIIDFRGGHIQLTLSQFHDGG